jgi:hypothetical protein
MPTHKIIHCPVCNKKYGIYEEAFTDFCCFDCNARIQYNVRKKTVTSVYKPPATYNHQPSTFNTENLKTDKSKAKGTDKWDVIVVGIFVACGIGFFLIIIIGGLSNLIKNSNRSEVKTQQAVTYSPPPNTSTIPTPIQPQTNTQVDNSPYQLCSVRIINTLRNTDKTGGYKASTDVNTKTLTLTFVDNPNEVISVHYDGGGLHTFKLYENGVLEATKTMYRRADLESDTKEIIYTSRTEQVKIIIKYD